MVESSKNAQLGEGPPQKHHWVKPDPSTMDDNVALYEIAYEQSKAALEDQSVDLNNMRTRTVQYLAFVASATAFLATSTIHASDKHWAFYTFASLGTSLALLVVVTAALVLNPWMSRLSRHADPQFLMKNWIEREVPAPNRGEMLRELSLRQNQWELSNEVQLRTIRVLYVVLVIGGALGVASWATLAWIAG